MAAPYPNLPLAKTFLATLAASFFGLVVFGGLTAFPLEPRQIPILHALVEIAGIILGCIVFFVAWYGTGSGHLRLIVGSLAVFSSAILSLVHLLSYLPPDCAEGLMPGHIWIASWIFSRLVWSFGLLYSLSLPVKPCNGACAPSVRTLFYGAMVAIGGLVANIVMAPNFWPYLYNIASQDHPLTTYGPLAACAADIASFLIVYRRPRDHVGNLPLAALFFAALADLCFALGGHSPASLNLAAHLSVTLANVYILRTLYIAVIRQPYEEMINLKENMEEMAENNARLYHESEQQRNLFEDILAKVGMIISSQLNLKETLDAIADMVADMMRARQSAIALYTEDNSALRVVATYGMNTPPEFIPLVNSVAGQVCAARSPLTIDDLLLHPELFRPQLVFSSVRSIIVAPLVNDQEIIGVIEAYSSEKEAFSARDLLLLKALGYHAGAAVTSATQHEQTKARLDEEKFLYQIAQASAATIDTDTILEQCLSQAARALNADFALAYLTGDRKACLIFKHSLGLNGRPADLDLDACPELAAAVKALAPKVLPQNNAPWLGETAGEGVAGKIMVMPLPVDSRLLGLIILGWRRLVTPESCRRNTFATLMAQQIALGLEKANLYNQVKTMALSDGLTGLANRRNFDMFLDTELRRASSLRRPLSLIMLDIDKFKVYNDTYGHLSGDRLLAQLGDILRHGVRAIDFPARYGGEEFSVILPECGNAEAAALADTLRLTIAAAEFPGDDAGQSARITASIGVATYDPALGDKPPDSAKFIAVADSALYQAKQSGRNKVVSAPVIG